MERKNITTVYKKTMKMSELIDTDFRLLTLLYKLNISIGFGDKNIDAVCRENNFDTNCFLFLANYQSNKSIIDVDHVFQELPLEPFLYYLKCSHNHFLELRLPSIRRQLDELFSKDHKDLYSVVLNFFDKYMKEVMEHMNYEDNVVFPYVDSLIKDENRGKYSIDIFEEVHTDIEGKTNDLIQILMKYVSHMSDQALLVHVLMELYTTGEELEAHRYIEDSLVIPRVREIEKSLRN